MINYPVAFAGWILSLAGFVGLGLTHFGIVSGFLWITPLIWAGALVLYVFSFGLRPWWALTVVYVASAIFLEAAIYYNDWGLRSVI